MKKLKHNITSVVNIGYHIVWCPKYRRKVLTGKIESRLKEILPQIAELSLQTRQRRKLTRKKS